MEAALLEFIACPASKEPLQWDRENDELIAVTSGLAYPIRDGIPILLADQSRKLSEAEREKWR